MGRLPRLRALVWLPLLLLSACASMNKSQCLSADWYAIGIEDGARGRPLEYLGSHRRACAEYGVAPDAQRYQAGRDAGLQSFCTYDRGYAIGRAGQGRPTVCPETLAANFDAGYGDGRQRYDLTREAEQLEQALAQLPGR